MPRVMIIEKRIFETEGFKVKITQNGLDLKHDDIIAKQYNYVNKAQGKYTVIEWINKRFKTNFSKYDIAVFLGNGEKAPNEILLTDVRESYRE